MSDENDKPDDAEADRSSLDEDAPALKALLKRSLAAPEPAEPSKEEAEKDRALLVGVQRKLRQRSKGKFYADGWSTTQSRVNYALVAGVMLVVVVAVYLAMGPMGISLH
ncbi:MAG: hypothetical protein KF819_18985 [Labilithrix sp.]|nr:hypothetical protein [Labilithrix sp.]